MAAKMNLGAFVAQAMSDCDQSVCSTRSCTTRSTSSSGSRGCGHCRNLRFPEAVIMNHVARNCPNMSCLTCKKKGHTESRCPLPAEQAKAKAAEARAEAAKAKAEADAVKKRQEAAVLAEQAKSRAAGRFGHLLIEDTDEESDEESDEEPERVPEKVVLQETPNTVLRPYRLTKPWADHESDDE